MPAIEFVRFLFMLVLANVFLRLSLSLAVKYAPNSDIPNALAFAI